MKMNKFKIFINAFLFLGMNIVIYAFLPISWCHFSTFSWASWWAICQILPFVWFFGMATFGILFLVFPFVYLGILALLVKVAMNILQNKEIDEGTEYFFKKEPVKVRWKEVWLILLVCAVIFLLFLFWVKK